MGQIRFEKIMGNVLASFFMAVILGVLGGMVWSGVLQRVRRLQNSMFLTPAFVFVIYGITEALGYSGAIAALAFGIVLGNASYFEFSFMRKILRKRRPQMQSLEEKEKSFFKEIVFILKTFFFVYIGIMIPKGLASAVLASMPRQVNLAAGYEVVPNAERIECMVYSIIFFSIVICSLLVLLSRKRIIDEEFKPEQMEEVYDYE